ncbi:type II toxin-antitoxin system HicB family antitoxin [Sporosarcina sp. Marseille-Q4943]|uniref:type II toxin-antitoxin system HicB family antitoxin n=1 Tax=Sporosarcina sp. Marseille-Q4943 TaxID=2942204 RepID=UPI00208DD412|nr:type II toxin-antitoxin system HicB family antitoxin [Sporosarcina sp. Marseille-Q4943]
MKKEFKQTAVFYYEHHYAKKGDYQIHVRFPDLLALGLPAFTVGNSLEDAIEAAKEILEMMVECAEEDGIVLPDPTPIEMIQIDRGFDLDAPPFRILVEHVSIYL